MTNKILWFLAFLISLPLSAQIKGKTSDQNDQPLAFVNVYIENTYSGTTSNTDGLYELQVNKPGKYTVVFQYLGFKTVKKEVDISSFPFVLNANLYEEQISLNEIVINSKENPADKIIKNAIASRSAHLKKTNTYSADFYSRGLIKIKNAPQKILGQDLGDLGGGLDSTRSGIIYLSETISKIEALGSDKLKEHIIASKISGDDTGFSFNTASDIDYNFYNNTIELGNQLISPISNYAFNYYTFKLEGVFYDDNGQLINKVKVTPKRPLDPIFTGYVYIVEDQWTLYALELDVTGVQAQIPPADNIAIKQEFSYDKTEDIWYLRSQNIDFKYGIFGIKGNANFTAVYSDYNFNPGLTKKAFGKEILSFEGTANKKDSTYWNSLRPVPLTNEEISDYIKKDSIQILKKSRPYLDSIDRKNNTFKITSLLSGYSYQNSHEKWRVGFTSPLSGIQFNTVQGFSSNIGLYYRKNEDEYRRYYSASTNFNYGLSDDRLRVTGSFNYKFNNTNKANLYLKGGVEAVQFDNSNPAITPLLNSISSLFFENNFAKLYDRTFTQAWYSQEVFNGVSFSSSLSYERRKALFNTTNYVFLNDKQKIYTSNDPLNPDNYGVASFDTHRIAKFNLNFRINFDQEYLSYPDSKINIPSQKYPTLFVGIESGFAATENKYNFNLLKARLTQDFNIGNKGEFKYNLKAGAFMSADDIAFMDYYHPNANQTHIGSSGSYLNVFNAMPYYMHSTNNDYAELHAEHDFKGFLLGKIPLINKLNFSLVLGAHTFITETTSPYKEFSVGFNNVGFGKYRIFRFDYVRSYQQGYQEDAFIFGLKF